MRKLSIPGVVCLAALTTVAGVGPVVAAPSDDPPICFGRPATIVGSAGDDFIEGTDGDDVIVTGGGDDFVIGHRGRDFICTGPGSDQVRGAGGRDLLDGGLGYDRLDGGPGRDGLFGRGGPDVLRGDDGDDRLFGGAGRDRLTGGDGDDLLAGGTGNDWSSAGDGVDESIGGAGDDVMDDGIFEAGTLKGNAGDDLIRATHLGVRRAPFDPTFLSGGAGDDWLEGSGVFAGGAGSDVCITNLVFGESDFTGCEVKENFGLADQ